MKVSPSGYFSWIHRVPSLRETENKRLLERIHTIHKDTRKTYGSPRITDCLKDEGFMVSRPRIARIMRKNGISASIKRRFRVTTDSCHDLQIAPNLLNRNFTTDQPGKVWTSDITYVAVQEGWLYLTVVEDLFNREIVGWSMSRGLRAAETTIPALMQACIRQKPKPGLIFHSDRGIQYACDDFRELLNNHQMIQSMSGTGNCYDNAVTESFFGTFKKDLIYRSPVLPNLKARQEIFKYIEMFYNRTRKHSANGNLSPVQFSVCRQAA